MLLSELIILALATWRISSLFANPSENGPFHVFDWIRYAVGIRYDARGEVAEDINEVAKAFACLWCFSVWVGTGWAILFYLSPFWAFWLALPFALSAVAVALDEYVNP